jgi:hypothetical protein
VPWFAFNIIDPSGSPPLATTTQEAPTCAYPGCKNEPQPGGKYCGLPDPASRKAHTALTSFWRRQELAAQGAAANPENRPGDASWHPRRRRRADKQGRWQAEADAEEARSAVLEADALLTAARAAQAAAERAVVAGSAAQARAAAAERTAEERVLTLRRERDEAESRARGAESRAQAAEQEATRARQAADSARQELDAARRARGPRRTSERRTSEGSMLGELVEGVSEAMDRLINPDR